MTDALALIPGVTIISDVEVLHPAGAQGDRVGRVVTIGFQGKIVTQRYWYNYSDISGPVLVRVTG